MQTLHGMKQNPWNPSIGITAKKQGLYHIALRSIFASLLLFLSFIFFECLIWFVFCGWGLNSNGFCFLGLRFYFYDFFFCWWGWIQLGFILFETRRPPKQQNSKHPKKKKKMKKKTLDHQYVGSCKRDRKLKEKEERRRQ